MKCNGKLTDNSSIILGRGNDVGQKVNIEVLNKLQAIPFSLDLDMVELLSDTMKVPEEGTPWYEVKERERAFQQLQSETNGVIDYLLENSNKFWFTWKYDKRGRIYSQGYHINPQGNAYRKALIDFAEPELLTIKGKRWLVIDIANCFGYDKDSWLKRTVEGNKMVKDIFKDLRSWKRKAREYSQNADSPELFLKAIYAYHKGVIKEEPIGHMMGLDATSSGIQITSAMAGCTTGARNSNLNNKVEVTMTEEAQAQLAELEAELASL